MKALSLLAVLFAAAHAGAQPGAEDKITCERQARAIVKSALQIQEGRSDIDVNLLDWGSQPSKTAGESLWFDYQGVIVDKNGNKIKDLNQAYSEITMVNSSGTNCLFVGYSIPNAD